MEDNTQLKNYASGWHVAKTVVRWTISGIASLLLLLFASGFIFSYFYQEVIRDYLVVTLQKNIVTSVSVGQDADVSFIRKFPYASVQLNDVTIYEKPTLKSTKADTLLYFESIFFRINVFDILNKNYTVNSIKAEDGFVDLKIDKHGKENFNVLKEQTSNDRSFSIKLKQVLVENTTVRYANRQTETDISGKLNVFTLGGNFSEQLFETNIECKAILWNVDNKGTRYITTKRIRLDGSLAVNRSKKEFTAQNTLLKIADLQIILNGKVFQRNDHYFTDLHLKGTNLNIETILSLIPEKYNDKFQAYKSKGTFYFTGNVNGKLSTKDFPLVEGNFGIRNGEISHSKRNVPLSDVNLTGYFSNGKFHSFESTSMELRTFHFSFAGSDVGGSLSIENFAHPTLRLSTDATLDLTALQNLVKFDTIETISGRASLAFDFKTRLSEPWSIQKADLVKASVSGELNISELNFLLKSRLEKFSDFNGKLKFKGNELLIQSLYGNVQQSDISLDGYFRNLLPYLLLPDGGNLFVFATLSSDQLHVEDFIPKQEQSRTDDTLYQLTLPKLVDANISFDVKQLAFGKFEAQALTGNIMLHKNVIQFNDIRTSAIGGELSLVGKLEEKSSSEIHFSGDVVAQNADISTFLKQTDNLGQQYIGHDNIKGNCTIQGNVKFILNPHLDIDTKSIASQAAVTITQGELVNFSPLFKLSKFMELDELKQIKFATLSNTIHVNDGVITIPAMELNNNLLNLNVEGKHSFTNDIDYSIQMKLSDVLSKKFSKKNNTEFGDEYSEYGSTSVFVRMSGKANNPVFAYDTKNVKQKLGTDWKNEKKNIKATLRNEFSRQLNDTVTKASTGQKPKLKISWEEEENTKSPGEAKPKETKPKKIDSKNDTPIGVEWE